MTDRILKALGATDEHEALRMVAEASEFMQNINQLTGRETYAGSLEVIRNDNTLSHEILATTEKKNSAEALGTVLAWKSASVELPKAQERVNELEEAGRARDVAALIKSALSTAAPSSENPHAGKLVPATAKFWETRAASELEAFLAVAPRVIPTAATPGAGATTSNATQVVNGRAADAQGRKYEEISASERASLKRSDSVLFNALREDWIAAGRPADAIPAQAN